MAQIHVRYLRGRTFIAQSQRDEQIQQVWDKASGQWKENMRSARLAVPWQPLREF